MDQVHRRFTADQVKVLLNGYCHGDLARDGAEKVLGGGKTRFFALLNEYRLDPEAVSIAYERETPGRLWVGTERAMEIELRRELRVRRHSLRSGIRGRGKTGRRNRPELIRGRKCGNVRMGNRPSTERGLCCDLDDLNERNDPPCIRVPETG